MVKLYICADTCIEVVWRLGSPLMKRLMSAYNHKILMSLNYIRLLNTSELYDFTSKGFPCDIKASRTLC